MPRPKAPTRLKQVLEGTLVVDAAPALPNVEDIIIPKIGRPSTYEPWMCDKIIEVAARRGHVAQMCLAIGISSKDTFYRWIKEYPEFGDAYKFCKIYSEAIIDQTFTDGMLGKIDKFNYSACERLARAKCGEEYKEAPAGTTINLQHITNNVNTLNGTQLDEQILVYQQRLGLTQLPKEASTDGTGDGEA